MRCPYISHSDLVIGTTRLSIVGAGLDPNCNGLCTNGTAYDRVVAVESFEQGRWTRREKVFAKTKLADRALFNRRQRKELTWEWPGMRMSLLRRVGQE